MSEFKSWDELSELEQLQEIYSDAYKSAYGFRPRGYGDFGVAELKDMIQRCSEEISRNEVIRESEEALAVKDFSNRIIDTIAMGAADRNTAIRWILDGSDMLEDFEYDRDFVCFKMGLPYGFFDGVSVIQ